MIFSIKRVLFTILSISAFLILIGLKNIDIFQNASKQKVNLNENNQSEILYDNVNKRVLCMVLTTEFYLPTRGVAVWETWGKKFKNLIFVCKCPNIMKLKDFLREQPKDKTPDNLKQYLPFIDYPIMFLDVHENYWDMGPKCMKTLNKSLNLYNKKIDWWYLIDDDAYVFTDNLFKFISQLNTTEPFIYGFHYTHVKPGGFALGGPGIIFTNESITRLVKIINKKFCNETKHAHGDIMLSTCAYQMNVTVNNSIDNFGLQRFHGESPYTHFYGPLPIKYQRDGTHSGKIGKDCCSKETIAFHYISPSLMYRMHSSKTFLEDLLEGKF